MLDQSDDQSHNHNEPEESRFTPLSKTRLIALFTGLTLAVFVGSLDTTIVATAAVPITSQFDAFPLYSWTTVSYLVALVASQPLYGSISNIFGRKGPMLFAAATFFAGSALCGWAPSMGCFIAGRALSGVGAGGLTGLSFITVADHFPLEERPKYQSILLAGFAVAAVLGPILGGVFPSEITWRWCFWINLPIIGLTFVILLVVLQFPSHQSKSPWREMRKFDFIGATLIIITLTCFVIPMSLGGEAWPWASAQVILLLVISAMSAVAFVLVELYLAKDMALIPPRLLKNRGLLAPWASLFFYSIVFTAFLYYMPIWLQVVEGRDPTIVGLLLVPFVFGLVTTGALFGLIMRLVSRFTRISPLRLILHIACTVFVIGISLCAVLSRNTPLVGLIFQLLVFGVGCGAIIQCSYLSTQGAVRDSDVAVAYSMAIVFEYLGSAAGLAISGTIHRRALDWQFKRIPSFLVSQDQLRQILKNPELLNEPMFLSASPKIVVQDAFAEALLLTFKVLAAFGGIVFLSAFLFVYRSKAIEGPSEVMLEGADHNKQ